MKSFNETNINEYAKFPSYIIEKYKNNTISKSNIYFSCWVDAFLFNFNYIFNDYLSQVNSENIEDLSKIEMLFIIIKYLNEISVHDLRKRIFAISSIEPYLLLLNKLNIEQYAGTFNNVAYLFNIFINNPDFCFKHNKTIYCNSNVCKTKKK